VNIWPKAIASDDLKTRRIRKCHGRAAYPTRSTDEHTPSDEQLDTVHHSPVEEAANHETTALNKYTVHAAAL
jgi:hypothetical protein